MRTYLELLVKLLPTKEQKVSLEILYKECAPIDTSFVDFKTDLIAYMKKKIQKFVIRNNMLSIEHFTHCEINELIKYFKIGTVTKEISVDTLYASWVNPYDENKNIFINKLEKYLISKEFKYFIFENSLFIKE